LAAVVATASTSINIRCANTTGAPADDRIPVLVGLQPTHDAHSATGYSTRYDMEHWTMTCPRNFTKEQIIAGLKAGRTLMQDRSDAPEYTDLLELEKAGLVTSELVVFDEQSSALRWRWKK
jgi:hypothetical protein